MCGRAASSAASTIRVSANSRPSRFPTSSSAGTTRRSVGRRRSESTRARSSPGWDGSRCHDRALFSRACGRDHHPEPARCAQCAERPDVRRPAPHCFRGRPRYQAGIRAREWPGVLRRCRCEGTRRHERRPGARAPPEGLRRLSRARVAPDAFGGRGARRGARLGRGDRGGVRLHRRHARRGVRHARSNAWNGRRHAATAARPGQAPRQGPHVHRAPSHGGGGARRRLRLEGRGRSRARARALHHRPRGGRGLARGHPLRQAVHRSRRGARPPGRARPRADGDRSTPRLGQRHGQALIWKPQTLGEVLLNRAPKAEALVTQTGRFTYRDLLFKAKGAAGAMQAMGLGHGDRVGILMGNDEKWLALFYGAALIGAVTVPVNTRFKAAEIDFCLKQSGCKALFYVERFLNVDFGAMVREIGFSNALDVSAGIPENTFGPGSVFPDDVLLIQFTSGTTAYPKGAMLTHDNMLRDAWAAGTRIGIRPDDRYFNCRPFFHVAGSTLSALMALVAGATLVTLPTFDAGAALEMLERERCTLISGNDTIFQMLMGHADFPNRKLTLRGGWAAAEPQTMRRIIDVMGAKEICGAYGLSEASPNVVMSDYRDPEELRVNGLAAPHDGVELRIVEGEIQVRGWNVMQGYYNNAEANAKAFTEDGWLRTGDLGELTSDGRLRMVGRLKDVFRVGGENVAPAEVEEVLLAHPAVQTAQVIGVPDARLGEVPAAYVTLKSGESATEREIVEWMKPKVANFRLPRYLRIVADFETIGMTASGKVQKTKLREHAVREFGL